MKKVIVSLVIIGTFILYSFFIHNHPAPAAVIPATRSSSDSASIPTETPTTIAIPGTTTTPTAITTARSDYQNGSYTGSVADAQWGFIQVKAIIKNGKITDVQFLQYPQDRNESVDINSYADPQLSSEAIQAQSANVDVVTGATDSSEAFIQSLSNALSQAQG